MPDKIEELILEGLARASEASAGLPLHGSAKSPALFAATAVAKQAAAQCKERGLIEVVRTECRGRRVQEVCKLSDKGHAYLLDESKRELAVLENRVQELYRRSSNGHAVSSNGRHSHSGAPAAAPDSHRVDILGLVGDWQSTRSHEDYPLPRLLEAAKRHEPTLTIGQFHDRLRQLHSEGHVYLHPWTGPLHEIPEPAAALLVGHAVVYYVSQRK